MAKIYNFETIEPKAVLKWFKKICAIPHGSFQEKELADMLTQHLLKAGCKVEELSSGALYIQQDATFGHDDWPKVLLQGHLDMVQVKDEGIETVLQKDPVPAYYDTENKWLKAEGTTLGADNGVAISMFMEVLTNKKIEHGPLEALFTVGEEVDTSVCMKSIPEKMLTSEYYINLDSDHDNTIYYASAGVYKVGFEIPYKLVAADKDTETVEINLKNFSGGHSALIIHNPHINTITELCRILLNFSANHSQLGLVSISGGVAFNSIPNIATAVVNVKKSQVKKLTEFVNNQIEISKVAAQGNENLGVVSTKVVEHVAKNISHEKSEDIFSFFAFAPNNVLTISKNSGCMFNSNNVGVVKMEDNKIISGFLPRSFYEPDLINLAESLVLYAKRFGCENVTCASSCASWLVQDWEKSNLINLWRKNYIKVNKSEPFILPNPGGLEVAEIAKKSPQLAPNAMSAGPFIFKEHSTFENCPVESIQKIWKILTLTLKGLNK